MGKKREEFYLGLVNFQMSTNNSSGKTEEVIRCGAQEGV